MSRRHIPYLRFHRHIIREVNLPETDDLLVMSKGLGMRRIICALLKAYDSKENLIIIVNATPTDEAGIGDELGTMGVRDPGLRVLNYATTGPQRTELYNKGGLFSVTSQILVVDLLKDIIPTKLITGIVVLHAERVTKTSQEAFAIRSYRKVNHTGFTKAFSDEPEAFAFGMSPLRDTLMNLNMRNVHFWPRFHELVKDTLASRKADVVELYQPLTPAMAEIQQAILECMEAMIIELKRNHSLNLDLEDLNVQNALFKSFDATVRKQLGPVWHKVGYKTRKYVADLTQLRQLLSYLLEYDCVHFASYIETIVFANKLAVEQAKKTGKSANTTDWLSAKPAGILVQKAMERMYVRKPFQARDADEDEMDALREMEAGPGPSTTLSRQKFDDEARIKRRLPPGSEIVLEELPKWKLLADVLEEIEQTLATEEEVIDMTAPGNNTILVMTTTDRTCLQLREYLSTMQRIDPATGKPTGNRAGRSLMLRRLRNHLNWKAGMDQMRSGYSRSGFDEVLPSRGEVEKETRQPLEKEFRDRRPINRRRKRGGKNWDERGSTPANMAEYVLRGVDMDDRMHQEALEAAAQAFADPLRSLDPLEDNTPIDIDQDELTFEELDAIQRVDDWDEHYGLVAPEELIIVRHFGGDDDEVMLQELRPRFVVLYDPDQAFIRRLEVFRTSNPGLALRVYQIMYQASSEEERYLGALSKESDAFSRLIRERGTMVIPIHGDARHPMRDPVTRAKTTYSSRNAGGGGADEPSIVVVDIREFRASLASLLDAAGIVVIPETLSVGDYVINPSMCVERKSLADLQASFANGRLHEQVEKMGRHYATPILLIEFEEHKFSLMTREDAKAHGKGKEAVDDGHDPYYLQGRLALLALNFPRLRIIWSSSPQESVSIIADLKLNHPEPDAAKAAAIGASADDTDGVTPAAFNLLPQEMLRALPGVTGNNWRYIASHARGIKDLVAMDEKEMTLLMGKDNGKACFEFLHKDGRRR